MHLAVWVTLLIVAGVAALSFLLGNWLARSSRMDDYGTRLGTVIASVTVSIAMCVLLWPPKLGIDLSGGVILIYEIDREATERQRDAQNMGNKAVSAADIVPAIQLRLNPGGLADIVVRPYGDDQIEVIIPRVEQAEVDRIKNIISKAGFLEFRIVANPRDHGYVIEAALDPSNLGLTQIKDEDGKVIGIWSTLGKEQKGCETGLYRMSPLSTIFRNHATGEVMTDENGNLRPEFLPADPKERQALQDRFREENTGERNLQDYFENKLKVADVDVLMFAADEYNVMGKHVDRVAVGFDERGFPSIDFAMTPDGAILFQGLTGENSPDAQTGFKRRLGILMDNSLISAPELRSTISRNGQITGRFTQPEVEDLVQIIRGGSLPAALNPQPATESLISPLLGGVTIRQSVIALAISLVFTLLVMAYYYRFSGLVACFALVTNLLITVAVMIFLKASFTLPGIAGLMLSVGMSVDANILIYGRIREELARGTKMRMALRNGFARATTTIVDSNVTTLIAGLVLYVIGTDIIRGFAVTLCLGLVISMFTAVFCARVILEIGDRRHWYRSLYMVQWVRKTNFNFMANRKLAIGGSIVLMVVGLVAAAARGVDLLDTDLAGGTSVHILLTEPLTETQLREKLEKEKFLEVYHGIVAEDKKALNPSNPDNAANLAAMDQELQTTDFDMTVTGLPEYTDDEGRALKPGQAWRIDTSIASVDHLKTTLQDIFDQSEGSKLIVREVDFTPPELVVASAAPKKESDAEPAASTAPTTEPASTPPPATTETPAAPLESPAPIEPSAETPAAPADPRAAEPQPPAVPEEPAATENGRRDLPGPNVLAMAGDGDLLLLAQNDAAPAEAEVPAGPAEAETPSAGGTNAEAPPAAEAAAEASPKPSEAATSAALPAAKPQVAKSESELTFRYPINKDALIFQLLDVAKDLGVDLSNDRLKVEPRDAQGKKWLVTLPFAPAETEKVLAQLKTDFADTPVFPSASKIGSKVAATMQRTAIAALVLSFLGIIIYLWVRFQKVAYGLAAVIATLHDVLITLGLVAISHWLAPYFGFLLIENFKISLSVIAAFLTLIGYSINDTIVIFDRIREVRGKSPHLSLAMINDSVNQTLSRTILTGGTVIVSLLVLYVVGGQGIRGFAYTMLVGILVGTYSSVFVGPPMLHWLTEGSDKTPKSPLPEEKKLAAAPAQRR